MQEEKKRKRSKEECKENIVKLKLSSTSTPRSPIFKVITREVRTTQNDHVVEEEKNVKPPIIRIEVPCKTEKTNCTNNVVKNEIKHKHDRIPTRDSDSEYVCYEEHEDPQSEDEGDVDVGDDDQKPLTLSKWSKYKKRYRPKWEADPKLKGWMRPHPLCIDRVSCSYCSCDMRAHKADLYKHSSTKKHAKNMQKAGEKGLLYSEAEDREHFFNTEEVEVKCNNNINALVKQEKTQKEKKKINPADNTCLVIENKIGETECIIMNCLDNDLPVETVDDTINDHELFDAANRIGGMLIKDIEKILKRESKIIRALKQNGGNSIFSEKNLQNLTKICIGHLSQQYLTESVLDTLRTNKSPMKNTSGNISMQLQAIEERMEKTVKEVKNLKMSFSDNLEISNGSFHSYDGHRSSTPASSHN